MPVECCPVCLHHTTRLLEASSQIARVNYYTCDGCLHVWTTSKQTDEFVRHITKPAETARASIM